MKKRTLQLRILRGLLWFVRHGGFVLKCGTSNLVYEWVADPNGSFDHWFEAAEGKYRLSQALEKFGFDGILWQILQGSRLLLGQARRNHWRIMDLFGEYFFSAPPLRDEIASKVFTQLLAADPKGDAVLLARSAYNHADAMLGARTTTLKSKSVSNGFERRASRLSPIPPEPQEK